MLNLHGLDVHDLAAVFALGENTFSFFPSYLEVFSLAAGTGEFPVIFVFFGCHLINIYTLTCGFLMVILRKHYGRISTLNKYNAEDE